MVIVKMMMSMRARHGRCASPTLKTTQYKSPPTLALYGACCEQTSHAATRRAAMRLTVLRLSSDILYSAPPTAPVNSACWAAPAAKPHREHRAVSSTVTLRVMVRLLNAHRLAACTLHLGSGINADGRQIQRPLRLYSLANRRRSSVNNRALL